jgi:nucleoside-diphosphate-sugar epimerase
VQKLRIMIVGAGDVAKRLVASNLGSRARWIALSRSADSASALRSKGILAVQGDLDRRTSLRRAGALARSAHATLYLAPPPNLGNDDPRMKRWLAASRATMPRQRVARRMNRPLKSRKLRNVYVSTTGVYGDRAGDMVTETSSARPNSARAKRRVAAETRVRRSKRFRGAILRAPGIYAAERLPIERLRERVPALVATEDVFTNHIHADDLARSVWLSMFRARPNRVLNIVDDATLKMGEYFDAVADSLALPRPPRMTRGELAQHVTPMMLSFMNESRRIGNARMKRELRIRLQFPTPQSMLATMKTETALQRSLL